MSVGVIEVAIVIAVVALLFGVKRLPELGRSLGASLREFKSGVTAINEPVELAKATASVTPDQEEKPK